MTIFDFPSRYSWKAAALTLCLTYAILWRLGISVLLAPAIILFSVTSGLLCLAHVYTRWRPEPKLATCAMGAAWLLTMGASAGVLTYPMAAVSGPLQDDLCIRFERAIGFDWQAVAQALNASPILQIIWEIAYASTMFQVAASVIILSFAGRGERLGAFLKMVFFSLIVAGVLSSLSPVLGPVRGYGFDENFTGSLGHVVVIHLKDFFALRDGSFGPLDLYKMEGIVTFPSFHCVLAALTAWALWPLRGIGKVMLVFNALVVISTVPQGGHYLIDIFAGLGIALGALALHYAPKPRKGAATAGLQTAV